VPQDFPHRGSAPPDEITRFARAFGALAAAADDLAQRAHGYRLLLTVPDEETSERFASWAKVAAAVEALEPRVPPLDEHDTLYVRGMLHALHTFARVRDGTALSYLDQVRAYLELSDIWVDENELSPLRDRLRDLLAQLELPTEVDRGLRMWEQRRRVPIDQVAAVATPLIAAAHEAAIAHGIPLPSEVKVDFIVRSTPYYAYAHYHGGFRGAVELSSEIDWTFESLKHSMCHEAFPGHQASASARESAIACGDWGPLVFPTLANTPSSPISEGLAENGTDMLAWVTTVDDELFAIHNALTFGVLTNAAILHHEYGEPRQNVIAFMVTEAGVSLDWATYQYGFLTDPLWHTSFPHYWHGAKLIRTLRERFRDREEAMYQALYRRPQSVATVRRLLDETATETVSNQS
jgi:hypothetical protein